MAGRSPKVHLLVRRRRSACGLDRPCAYTKQPRLVTCTLCQRTVAMADAEIRLGPNSKK